MHLYTFAYFCLRTNDFKYTMLTINDFLQCCADSCAQGDLPYYKCDRQTSCRTHREINVVCCETCKMLHKNSNVKTPIIMGNFLSRNDNNNKNITKLTENSAKKYIAQSYSRLPSDIDKKEPTTKKTSIFSRNHPSSVKNRHIFYKKHSETSNRKPFIPNIQVCDKTSKLRQTRKSERKLIEIGRQKNEFTFGNKYLPKFVLIKRPIFIGKDESKFHGKKEIHFFFKRTFMNSFILPSINIVNQIAKPKGKYEYSKFNLIPNICHYSLFLCRLCLYYHMTFDVCY